MNESEANRTRRCPAAFLAVLLLIALVPAGCGEPEFRSRWRDRDVVIDGDPGDWTGAVYALDGETTVVGVRNDSTDLYLCFASSESNIRRQVLRRGMTLWFDPRGGRERRFGIRFPLPAKEPAAPPSDHAADPDREAFALAVPDSTAEVEIIEPGAPPVRMPLGRIPGIQVRVGLKEDVLTYEARIPLAADDRHPYAIRATWDRPIGLGLETPDFKRPAFDPGSDWRKGRGTSGGPSDDSSSDPSRGSPDDSSDDDTGGPTGGSSGRHRGGWPGSGRSGGLHGQGRGPMSSGPLGYWILVRLDASAAGARAVSAPG